jgi:RHS repeat-associated protein
MLFVLSVIFFVFLEKQIKILTVLGCRKLTYYLESEPRINTFSEELTTKISSKTLRSVYLFGFNGKENDNEVKGEGSQQDYGMRIYDPRLGRFLSPDPLIVYGKKYPELSTYQFASNTPIWGIDWDGLEVRLYTETTGLTGHTFLTVGSGDEMVVYTYGRYLGGDKNKSYAASTDPTGSGVLVRLTGGAAKRYVDDEIKNKNAKGYEIKDVKDATVKTLADKVFKAGRKITKEEDEKDYKMNDAGYGTADDARVIDKYKLFESNCTTKVVDVLKVAGSKERFSQTESVIVGPDGGMMPVENKVNTPFEMKSYLESETKSSSNVKKIN